MAGSVSKTVARREGVARTVESAVELHGPEVVAALVRVLFPEGAPPSLSMSQLIAALGAALNRDTLAMSEADVALAAESADDPPIRAERDERFARLRLELQDVRALISATYGDAVVGTYSLGGTTPERPDLLRNQATSVIGLLRERPFTAPPKPGRAALDAGALADGIEGLSAALGESLGAVTREEREYQLALERRDAAVESWTRTYRGVAGVVSSLFDLAGREDLAARVRPTTRRSAGITEPEELEPTEPEPTPEPEPNPPA
jgi:hypothetical protein